MGLVFEFILMELSYTFTTMLTTSYIITRVKKTLYFCMEHNQIKIRLLMLYTGVILMLLSKHHVNNGQNAMIFNN